MYVTQLRGTLMGVDSQVNSQGSCHAVTTESRSKPGFTPTFFVLFLRKPLALIADLTKRSGSSRRVFGLRSAGAGENSNSDQDDHADRDPHLRNSNQNRGDGESDDQNDEADQISAE